MVNNTDFWTFPRHPLKEVALLLKESVKGMWNKVAVRAVQVHCGQNLMTLRTKPRQDYRTLRDK